MRATGIGINGSDSKVEVVVVNAAIQSDAPSDIDELGAHERVAASIDRLIANSSGGKTIALEGKWGAGKSTVIRLLVSKCKARNTAVHQYDAWAHAGDPLRRAFLASLIDHLTNLKWLPDDRRWKANLDTLAGKRRDSEKITSPKLTAFGLWLATSLLLLPGALICLGKSLEAIFNARSIYIEPWPCALFWLGLTLSVFPLILCLGNVAYCKFVGEPRPNYLAILLNKQSTIEKISVTESGDQTTIEFQHFFNEIVNSALGADATRKLVLVIDNLDRMNVELVENVWSLLQSFVDMSQFAAESWHARLWIIVPIAAPPDSAGSEALGPHFNAPFLDKIFQARFKLPPPILKNWRPYLGSRLAAAIPAMSVEERERVVNVFLAASDIAKFPTPRELVLFVNQLVVFAEQWKDEFALDVGAAYLAEQVDTHLPLLIEGRLPRASVQRLLNIDLKAAYACIYFNTGDSADALDLLQRPLATSLVLNAGVQELARNLKQHESFAHVLLGVLAELVPQLRNDALSKCVAAICTVASANQLIDGRKDAEKSPAVEAIESLLVSEARACVRQLETSILFSSWIVGLLDCLKSSRHYEQLVSEVQTKLETFRSYSSDELASLEKEGRKEYLTQTLNGLLNVAELGARLEISESDISVPAVDAGFARLLHDLGDSVSEGLVRKLNPVNGELGATQYIAKEIVSGDFSSVDTACLNWLRLRGGDVLTTVVRAMETLGEQSDSVTPRYSLRITEAFFRLLSEGASFPRSFDNEITESFAKLIAPCLSDDGYDAAADLILIAIMSCEVGSEDSMKAQVGILGLASFFQDPSTNPKLLNALKARITLRNLAGWLFNWSCVSPGLGALASAYFQPRATLNSHLLELDVSSLDAVDNLCSAIGDYKGVDQFISLRSDNPALLAAIKAHVSDFKKWRWLDRVIRTSGADADLGEVLRVACDELRSLRTEDWLPARYNSWQVSLAHAVRDRGLDPGLSRSGDLVRSQLDRSAGGETVSWPADHLWRFASLQKRAVLSSICGLELDRAFGEGSHVLEAGYWALANRFLTRAIEVSDSERARNCVVIAIERIDPAALSWLKVALVDSARLQDLVREKAFREACYEKIRAGLSMPKISIESASALRSVKSEITRLVRKNNKKQRGRAKKSKGDF
ncbi:P-loop NTPase fold protein [Luteibacter sp. UNCMF366Tsu5.1]|uniref:P-loop NTPase fold protein n=1 Tax=Luteibacter sp. UNCMF366Tsu5.1 TaxID=1502758 RepID=UPI0009089F5D|nr:P-loop NTPase fold protein [Luteibacter sp. UNCMF366Tsu5.1]SFW55665.1 KAP family P-loop domain-containing protein [Luteibacter sp. UNCMF366Tsu5.1]